MPSRWEIICKVSADASDVGDSLVPEAFVYQDLAAELRHSKVEDPGYETLCFLNCLLSAFPSPTPYNATSIYRSTLR